jgi:hypothetical protein
VTDPLGERLRGRLEALPDSRAVDAAWVLPVAVAVVLNATGVNDGPWFWIVPAACVVAGVVLLVQLLGRASRAAARGELI